MYTITTPRIDALKKEARARKTARAPWITAAYIAGFLILILAASYGDTITGINPS